jgi:ABC-2 type transport system permease protein
LSAALLIAGKDLRQRMRDRSALLVALLVPLVLASIFGLIFHDAIGGKVTFTFGLVDQDRGVVSRIFESAALRPLERQGLVTIKTEPTLSVGKSAANSNRVSATFVLPAGLSAAVASGRPASIRVLGSVDAAIGAQVAESIATSFATRIDALRIATRAGVRVSAAGLPTPIAIADVSTESRQLDAGTFYAAGMAVFFVFFTVQFGISSILDERRDGTLARIMLAPIPRGSVLGGKLLTSLILGFASMVVLAVATHFLLSATWGNPLGVGLLIAASVLAATGVMALVATFARTPDQAQSWQTMVALVLGMLGGTFFPVAQAGGVLAVLSLATPQAWFLRGIENLAGGAGPRVVLGPAAAILAFALITGGIAFTRANRLVTR